jgi:hypothetical protein
MKFQVQIIQQIEILTIQILTQHDEHLPTESEAISTMADEECEGLEGKIMCPHGFYNGGRGRLS